MPSSQTTSAENGAPVCKPGVPNIPAPGISYFTPRQNPPSGTASNPNPHGNPLPKLFQPLKLRGCTFQNRIMLSPLCQYSSDDGHATSWHMAHLGGILSRGPGLTMIEATAISPEGRSSPEDAGLWKDSQIEPLRKIVEFAHSQGQKIGIQLAHTGRKGSLIAPWLEGRGIATKDVGGWPDNVMGPSAIRYDENHAMPKAMSLDDIAELKDAWVLALKRALQAGVDLIEIHNGHGYLFHQFISPATNQRTDKYGGSFENRTRLTMEIVDITRSVIPEDMPLFLRLSASDCLEHDGYDGASWTLKDSVKLAGILAQRGVDLLDVTAAGNHSQQRIHSSPGYQAPAAKTIKEAVGDKMAVGVVGMITGGKQANDLLEDGLDLAIAGRGFLKNPGLVWAWAEELGNEINVANQIRWGFKGRVGALKK